jgi:hypothetical protein
LPLHRYDATTNVITSFNSLQSNVNRHWMEGIIFLLMNIHFLTITSIYLFASLLYIFPLERLQSQRNLSLWRHKVK